MHHIRVPLSDSAFAFVEAQAASRGFAGPEEYITGLVEAAQKGAPPYDLEQLLLDGLNSGTAEEYSEGWLESKKQEWIASRSTKQLPCGD